MLKAIQELSYPQDRNATWLPDIQLPIFSQYRLQLEKGKFLLHSLTLSTFFNYTFT